jgi:hypothetical protein
MDKPLFHVYLEHRITGRCTVKLTKKPVTSKIAKELVEMSTRGGTRNATMRFADDIPEARASFIFPWSNKP